MLFCLAYVLGLVYYSATHSWFLGQDFDHLVLLQKLGFKEYLLEPIDIHNPLPLHRFFCWLFYQPLKMSFAGAMAFLGVLHLAGVYFFYRVLQCIKPGLSSALLAGGLCVNFYVLDLFSWWSAGLHRFPYLALIFIACYMTLAESSQVKPVRTMICVALVQLIGLGFFEKAVFLPIYLAVCLAAVYGMQGRFPSRAQLAIVAATFALSLGYWMVSPHGHQESPTLEQTFAAGFRYFHYYLISFLPWRPVNPPRVAIVGGFFVFFAVASMVVNGRLVVAIGFLILALVANIIPLAHSSRVLLFGQDVVLGARYFHDNFFLLLMFFHLIAGVLGQKFLKMNVASRAMRYGLVSFFVVYGVVAFVAARQEMTAFYLKDGHSGGKRAAKFIANLEQSIRSESVKGGEIHLQDRIAPQALYVAVFGWPDLPLSKILMWYDKRAVFVESKGGYAINDDGTLQRLAD